MAAEQCSKASRFKVHATRHAAQRGVNHRTKQTRVKDLVWKYTGITGQAGFRDSQNTIARFKKKTKRQKKNMKEYCILSLLR